MHRVFFESRLFLQELLYMIAPFFIAMQRVLNNLSLDIGSKPMVPSVVSYTLTKGPKRQSSPKAFNPMSRRVRVIQHGRGRGNKDRGSHQSRVF